MGARSPSLGPSHSRSSCSLPQRRCQAASRGSLLTRATCHAPQPICVLKENKQAHVQKVALGHHVLRRTRVDHNGGFLPCPLLLRVVGPDGSVIQTPALLRRLLQGSGMLGFDPLVSPPDSVPFGPTPVSLIVRRLQTRTFFWFLSLKITFP